ncbi:hypothetical protein RPB_1532 [Rhodopseudomonas palustris HaA2]|uniref:Polysaccharide biosynthesis protein n=1 Tax=Rhodopseudomonas palustris (strain HaA2) TaxID=316058 RepID=Q2IZW8_RHOP2|nr:oligosaccharide flippase family protein [Rhodopseudomonas palustris]ABD06242.1 hypothetical protein RPB_1532 [Rhodopseudomonas palustris HaA2]
MRLIAAIRGRLAGRMIVFLIATCVQVVLAIALLPLTTVVLTAADFGTYALLMSVAAFANALGDGGGSLALPAHYAVEPAHERRAMLASFFVVSFCLSSAVAIVFVIAAPQLGAFLGDADGKGFAWSIVGLTAVLIPLRAASALATTVFSVSGRGNAIAAQMVAQAIGTFVGTLVCLFGLHLGVVSLFGGAVIGQLAALSVSVAALGAQPWASPTKRWLRVVRHNAPTAAFAGVTDGARGIGENALIGSHLGLAAVGILSHARLYYGMLLSASNAVAHNVWSVSLAESREDGRAFARTEAAWTPVHMAFTLFGVGFVCAGTEFVSMLTNDRLTPAALYVPWLVIVLLVHISGRAQAAVLYARGAAPLVSRTRAILSLAILAALPFVIGSFGGIGLQLGLSGAVAALILEAALFRGYLRWKSGKFAGPMVFQDGWAFGGIVLIALSWLLSAALQPSLPVRAIFFGVVVVATIAVERKRLAEMLNALHRLYKAAHS